MVPNGCTTVEQAIDEGVPQGIVFADAGYGNDTAFRTALLAEHLAYALGVQGSTAVWAPGTTPPAAEKMVGQRSAADASAA